MEINNETYFTLNKPISAEYENTDTINPKVNAKTKELIAREFKEKMKNLLDPTSGMSDEDKAKYEQKINQKIKNGEKLTSTEMNYLRIKSPYVYALISRVQLQRQALEDKLKNCRSKEEVEEAYNFAISHIAKDDPAREPLQAAYDNVTKEFKKSSEYKNLPRKTDNKDKKEKIVTENSKAEEFEAESKYLPLDDRYTVVDFMA